MRAVTQDEQDRLLEKQWRARVALQQNPLARAMNVKLRLFYRNGRKAPRPISAIK